jgi:hypothetical protein
MDKMTDAERYRWLVNFASSFDGTADSDNQVRLWFYRPDKREVMVVGKNLDEAIKNAKKEQQLVKELKNG